ncbi:TPA: acyltransferase [Vibrio cholerae]
MLFLKRKLTSIYWKLQKLKLYTSPSFREKFQVYGTFDIVSPENFSFGSNLSINPYTYINATSSIELGDNVSLSSGSKLITTGLIYENKRLTDNHFSKPIKIGNRVQIGAGAIILPGVTICDDVLIGAGSVVTKDISDKGIYAGCPAKKI